MEKIVHIDESGDPVLNDKCYVICAVICSAKDLDHDLSIVDQVRNVHRGGGELKSAKTGSRLDKRLEVCRALSSLKSKCVVMIIKKDRLEKDGGFQFKSTTYKYCQRRLFEKIYKGMNQIKVVIDTHGRQQFMDSFKPYIDRHFQPTLFASKEIRYSSPIASPLLQVADYVGGTIRRHVQGDDDDTAYKTLQPILGMVEVWPREKADLHLDIDTSSMDQAILRHCTHAAEEYLQSEDDEVVREALQYLLYSIGDNSDGFIYGDKLLAYLKSENLVDKSRDKGWLRQSVIAKLRKGGVPIAASRGGYKIPTSVQDLSVFVEFVAQKTIPYLDKVNHMRNNLFVGMGMTYDMLDHEPGLKKLMAPLNQDEI